jgi:hypothetical protein
MALIRHCIVDTTTNKVVNIIEYETEQTGAPSGLGEHLLCVPSDNGQIDGTYENGVITNPSQYDPVDPPNLSDIKALLS